MDFVIGGIAATCAGVCTNPLDVIKTRQQLQGELQKCSNKNSPYRGILHSVRSIVRSEGILALQKGLGPALSFQFLMNSTRLGLFETVDSTLHWTKFKDSKEHSPVLCAFWGGMSGVFAAAISSPLYLVKTQIQAQSYGQYAVGYQHNHKGTIDALKNIFIQNGIRGLWKGCAAIVPRTAVGSATQLTTFTQCKDILLRYEVFQNSNFLTAGSASMVSGFFTAVFMTPFDVVATRIFNQGTDKNGKGLLYRGIVDCFFKTLKIEGIAGLYKGFVSNYWRIAPHTVLNLTFWEQFKKMKQIYLTE